MKMYKIVKNIRNQVVRNQKSMYQLAKAAPKTSEGPEGTRRDQDRGISRDQKGPERTRKDQKGPERTRKDQVGPVVYQEH